MEYRPPKLGTITRSHHQVRRQACLKLQRENLDQRAVESLNRSRFDRDTEGMKFEFGGPCGDRTHDLRTKSPMLINLPAAVFQVEGIQIGTTYGFVSSTRNF